MSEWIDVKDNVPKTTQYVLAYSDDIYILKFNIGNDKRRKVQHWYFEDTTGYCDCHNVTHWMPLPKPPTQ